MREDEGRGTKDEGASPAALSSVSDVEPSGGEVVYGLDGADVWRVAEPSHGVRGYRDLVAWQRAGDLVVAVYQASERFPTDERFGLTAQIRRAAVSVPSNIAEGWGRQSKGEYAQFVRYARGSLYEVETQILLAQRLGFVGDAGAEAVLTPSAHVARLLRGLARHLRS